MDKSTKWIIAGIIVVFGGLIVATNLLNQQNDPMKDYDTTTIIPANDQNGEIGDTISGDEDAPAKLVVYTDYQCNNCASLVPSLEELVEEYDGKLAVVYRIMIMSYHQNGRAAAAAVLAAAKQGYFEEYKKLIYEQQDEWASSDASLRQEQFEGYFNKVTKNKGDLEQFRADMESDAVAAKISFDDKLADHDGVQWTPYILFDGELISQQGVTTRTELLNMIREKVDAKLAE